MISQAAGANLIVSVEIATAPGNFFYFELLSVRFAMTSEGKLLSSNESDEKSNKLLGGCSETQTM